jgi:hypothetical protein
VIAHRLIIYFYIVKERKEKRELGGRSLTDEDSEPVSPSPGSKAKNFPKSPGSSRSKTRKSEDSQKNIGVKRMDDLLLDSEVDESA